MTDATTRAYLGLGSNVGDKAAMLAQAVEHLAATPGIRVTARSADYRTPPWGETDQDWFLNGALEIETDLDPHALLDACLGVERDLRAQTRVAEGNSGASVVPDLKYAIKIGRQNGIHVTPTALWNGVVEPSVSSSFGRSEWSAFFESHVPRAKA